MAGMFESLATHQRFTIIKPSKLVVTINDFLVNLFVRQTFLPKSLSIHFHQTSCYKVVLVTVYKECLLKISSTYRLTPLYGPEPIIFPKFPENLLIVFIPIFLTCPISPVIYLILHS